MPFYFFVWTGENEEHLADHGVTPKEFEEVVVQPDFVGVSRSFDRPTHRLWPNGRWSLSGLHL